MNELISSFAGKRLAAFAALVAAIALLASGGAFSLGTAQAQSAATGYDTRGLDHMNGAGDAIQNLKVTLVTGFRHTVCLVDDIAGQRFRADTDTAGEPGDPTDGAVTDIDDLDWEVTTSEADGITIAAATAAASAGAVGDIATGTTGQVRGPRAILTSPPSGTPPALGWNWVIMKKAGSEGSPTVTNPARRFGNGGGDTRDTAEACVFWTSTAPGTQVVQLYQANNLRVSGSRVLDLGFGDATAEMISAAGVQLEVTWVDADPTISVTRPPALPPVTAPIAQRMVLNSGATAFVPADGADADTEPDAITLTVNAFQDAARSTAQLTGTSVSFAVTGTCGQVTVPGAAGTGVMNGVLRPGLTGAIAQWGSTALTGIVFSNTGAAPADCKRSSSSTTLTITAGAASQAVTVNWEWDGYGEYTVEDVDDTTKKVTFHTAVPRTYLLTGAPSGWTCDAASMARMVTFDLDGRASVTGFARRNTVNGTGSEGPDFVSVTTANVAANTTPKRTLAAGDSECQVSWTVKSPSRAEDVYLDISSLGVESFSRQLSFAPEAPAVMTLDDLERPLYPGRDQIVWPGEDTPVGDALGDSGAIAIHQWVGISQSWVSYFPGSEGLGVNTLTMLSTNGIYFIVTPAN